MTATFEELQARMPEELREQTAALMLIATPEQQQLIQQHGPAMLEAIECGDQAGFTTSMTAAGLGDYAAFVWEMAQQYV